MLSSLCKARRTSHTQPKRSTLVSTTNGPSMPTSIDRICENVCAHQQACRHQQTQRIQSTAHVTATTATSRCTDVITLTTVNKTCHYHNGEAITEVTKTTFKCTENREKHSPHQKTCSHEHAQVICNCNSSRYLYGQGDTPCCTNTCIEFSRLMRKSQY